MIEKDIIENVLEVKRNIEFICKDIGRNAADITILAVTKTVESDRINVLSNTGISVAGENRVQEFLSKYEVVQGIKWHFIGTLQRNKIKFIIDKVDLVHSVDRVNLALELNCQCEKKGKIMPVLLQINVGDEETKGGVNVSEIEGLYNFVKMSCPFLEVQGFMAVLPYGAGENLYKEMQEVFKLYSANDKNIKILSMGMSDDYLTAIKYGATIIRLGSCIFGARNYN